MGEDPDETGQVHFVETESEDERLMDKPNEFPKGTRVELVSTTDPYTPLKAGDQGVVNTIDSVGTIHVNWDSGSSLGLLPGYDEFRVVEA